MGTTLAPPEAREVPYLPWGEFLETFQWEQGDHLTTVGPTKSGKSTLVSELLRPSVRPAPWVCVFASKRRDPLIDAFRSRGYRTMGTWAVHDPELVPRVIIAPPMKGFDSIPQQRAVFRDAMDNMLRQGGWTLNVNETLYISKHLGLAKELEALWYKGRTEGITLVAESQRPRHIPLLAYDQARHLFLFRNTDTQSLRRLGEIGGAFNAQRVQRAVSMLGFHHVLYVDTEQDRIVRTAVDL